MQRTTSKILRSAGVGLLDVFGGIDSHEAIYAAGHVTEVAGPVQALDDYLKTRGAIVAFAKHPFAYTSISDSTLEWRSKEMTHVWKIPRLPGALAIPMDILTNLLWFCRLPRTTTFIGIDALNAFCGIILRMFGRVERVVYYVIDYTPRRFASPIANWLYHAVDRFAATRADAIWNISSRIAAIREAQGVPPAKNLVVNVGVNLDRIVPAAERRPHDLVVISHLTESKGVQAAISAMPEITSRVPDARLLIIGTGPYEATLRDLATRCGTPDGSIVFAGLMNHETLFRELPKAGIAIATYVDNPDSITYYADPTKPKEYLACGLPVIITDVPWIARRIAEEPMGLIVDYDAGAIARAAVRLMEDADLYATCVRNAQAFAATLHWNDIYDRAFAEAAIAI